MTQCRPWLLPIAADLERAGFQAEEILLLARVDLDLELEWFAAPRFRRELEDQMHRVGYLFTIALTEPGESFAYCINGRADRFHLRLHEIDVFRVAQWLSEQQLVNGRAATKGDFAFEILAVEEIANRTADDKVLLHLPEIRPGSMCGPFLQVRDGYHRSISTGTLMMSFQAGFFSSSAANSATIGLTAGSSALKDFALSANGRSESA